MTIWGSFSVFTRAEFLNRDLSGLSQAALRIEQRAEADDLLRKKLNRVMTRRGISVRQLDPFPLRKSSAFFNSGRFFVELAEK